MRPVAGASKATVESSAPATPATRYPAKVARTAIGPGVKLLIATPSRTSCGLNQPSCVTSRLWRTGTSTNPPPKNTRPILKKVVISTGNGPAAKNANGIKFTLPLPATFPGWCGCLAPVNLTGRRKPAAPAVTSTQTAFHWTTPAARAPVAINIAGHERSTLRPIDQPAFKIKAITTGASPATAPCKAGGGWGRKERSDKMRTRMIDGAGKAPADNSAPAT